MSHLVTQVNEKDDPVKLAELAKLQAQQLAQQKKKEQETTTASSSTQLETETKDDHQHGCCWRFFCSCFSRKNKPTKAVDRKTDDLQQTDQKPQPTVVDDPPVVPKTQKFLMPPLPPDQKGKKTLVLDLDETLVHSSFRPVPGPDFIISIELDGVTHRVYVQKRPGVDQFLEQVGAKFEVVVFTASLDKYANPVLDILDPKGHVKVRLFREACVQHYGNYVKDLSLLGRRLEDTLIIDNSPFSYMFQPDNAIPITSWFNDKTDRELYELVPFLVEQIIPCEDVAQVIVERKQMAMNANGQTEMIGGEEEEDEEAS